MRSSNLVCDNGSCRKERRFLNSDNSYKFGILFLFWVAVILSIVYSGMRSMADKYNDIVKGNGILVFQNLLQAANQTKKAQLATYRKVVTSEAGTRFCRKLDRKKT